MSLFLRGIPGLKVYEPLDQDFLIERPGHQSSSDMRYVRTMFRNADADVAFFPINMLVRYISMTSSDGIVLRF